MQTIHMKCQDYLHRLIWVFTRRTCNIVGNSVTRLKSPTTCVYYYNLDYNLRDDDDVNDVVDVDDDDDDDGNDEDDDDDYTYLFFFFVFFNSTLHFSHIETMKGW